MAKFQMFYYTHNYLYFNITLQSFLIIPFSFDYKHSFEQLYGFKYSYLILIIYKQL